jgi:hypothetical protein
MNFSGSRALSEGFEILKSRFGVLIGTTLIFYVALFAVMAAFGGTMMQVMMAGAGSDPSQAFAGMGLTFVLMYLLIYAIQFAQALATMRLCSDRHAPSIGDAIGAGFRGVPTMFGAVILLAVVGIIGALVVGVVLGLIMAAANSSALGVLLGLIGLVGGIYIAARLSMLTPVIAIDEERNPINAIARSWRMTGSAALKIALVYGAAIVLVVVVFFIILALTVGTSAFTGGQPNPAGLVGFAIGMLVFALSVGLYLVALVAAIHRQLTGGTKAADTFN